MTATHAIAEADIKSFCDDPFNMAYRPAEQIFSMGRNDIDRIQLAGLRKRFTELASRLPVIKQLVDENRLTDIHEINDLVPLLLPHTSCKSYPLSLIDNCRFSQLNAWLDQYTIHDLSGLDVSQCQSLDEWLDVVEAQTPVRVITSSGTSGKLSLIPRSVAENERIPAYFSQLYSPFRDEPGFSNPFSPDIYHVSPQLPGGRHSTALAARYLVQYAYDGDPGNYVTPAGEMSTDLLWMTGRMRKAQIEGTIEQLKKTKAWRRLSEKLVELEGRRSASLEDFYRDMLTRLKGKTVILRMGLTYFQGMIETAEKYGIEIEFAPDSFVTAAGGMKGAASLTTEQMDKIHKALPFEFGELYACSELYSGLARKCTHGNYHAPPWLVGYVLNPTTGVPYPRIGEQTGRYAAFDLWATTYWGGYITGDEVTINWDGDCECGRTGPYMHGNIVRYSDKNGGDDKITCQRTAAAMSEMIDHFKENIA